MIVQEDGNQVDLIGATHYVKRPITASVMIRVGNTRMKVRLKPTSCHCSVAVS